jgi:hypothetical protein
MRVKYALTLLLLVAGCPERRKPIALKGDAGPAVVVVEPNQNHPQNVLLQVPLADEKEPDDDLAHAQPLEAGKGIKGTIAAAHLVKGKPASDEDFYSWTEGGAAGDGGARFHEARLTLGGVAGVDLMLEALDGDGKRLWLANEGAVGEGETIANLAVDPGSTYYVRVRAAGTPPAAETAPYQLVVQSAAAPAGAEREPNDDAAHPTMLADMSQASGFWGRKHDEDWLLLPVHLPEGANGGILRVELSAVDGVAPQIKVMAGGDALASARGQKGDELRLRNVGVTGGTTSLLVQLRAGEGKNLEARWLLKVGVEPPLSGSDQLVEQEPNDSVEKANTAAAGQTLSGFLWPGDADVFCLPEDAQTLVRAAVEAMEGVDFKLDRLGRDGRVRAHADEGGAGKPETLPPAPGGCVRVTARGKDSVFDAPYRLSFVAVPLGPDVEREPNDAPAAATHWPDGTTAMHGWLAPRGDEDWFRFTAPAGKSKVSATVEGGVPAVLKLVDENRAPLGPSTGKNTASGPVVAGKSYLVSVKAQSEKAADALDAYTVTLVFE